MPLAPFLVVLALTAEEGVGLGGGTSLRSAASATSRPPECQGSRRGVASGPTVWQLARRPYLQRYCDLVARAHAELPTSADAARKSAEAAEATLPGRAGPQVILARAALSLGAVEDAEAAFARARARDPRSLEDPATMHDLALLEVQRGRRAAAAATYRALVPRVDLLAGADAAARVLFEAAIASMAAEATAPTGPDGAPRLDEAIAYLREARQRPPTQWSGDVLLALALALDRSGDAAQADAALAEAHEKGARPRVGQAAFAAPEDHAALEALSLATTDRAAAAKAWEAFLAGPGGKGPWAKAARARLDALSKTGKPAAKAPAKKRGKPR